MKQINRRTFLKGAAVAAAATSLPARVWAQSKGANGDIRVAVVGFNSRGKDHLSGLSKVPGVRITALCDVDQKVLDREVQKFQNQNQHIDAYVDIRKLVENKDIDVVTIATPSAAAGG